MNWIDLVGHLGSLLSSITFLPQLYKTYKTKSAGDLSYTMLGIVFTSTLVWLVYGGALQLWPVIICNAVICAMVSVLIFFKISYRQKNNK
ncbi:MAG TPA: SemiSWEET family transporter [Phnomibacter sp.]|nr:SemiSWEET family transporter [Phnomibacter sp.]